MKRRLAAGFVLASMVAGSIALWIGAPVLGLWLGSKMTSSFGPHLVIALMLSVTGMLVVALGLAWANDLYLRITGGAAREVGGITLRRQGPLEPLLLACLACAIVAFLLWFFVLAENPTVNIY